MDIIDDPIPVFNRNRSNNNVTKEYASDLEYIAQNIIDDVPLVQEIDDNLQPSAKRQAVEASSSSSSSEEESDSEDEDDVSSNNNNEDDDDDDDDDDDIDLDELCEEEENTPSSKEQPKTKNELKDESIDSCTGLTAMVPRGKALIDIGNVIYRIDLEKTVVVEANGKTDALDVGAMLCSDKGIVLGRIVDIFGPVTKPFYALKWAIAPEEDVKKDDEDDNKDKIEVVENDTRKEEESEQEQKVKHHHNKQQTNKRDPQISSDIARVDAEAVLELFAIGNTAFYCPVPSALDLMTASTTTTTGSSNSSNNNSSSAKMVMAEGDTVEMIKETETVSSSTRAGTNETEDYFISKADFAGMMSAQGCDASNRYDEEVAPGEQEFSDDEQEQQFKHKAKGNRPTTASAHMESNYNSSKQGPNVNNYNAAKNLRAFHNGSASNRQRNNNRGRRTQHDQKYDRNNNNGNNNYNYYQGGQQHQPYMNMNMNQHQMSSSGYAYPPPPSQTHMYQYPPPYGYPSGMNMMHGNMNMNNMGAYPAWPQQQMAMQHQHHQHHQQQHQMMNSQQGNYHAPPLHMSGGMPGSGYPMPYPLVPPGTTSTHLYASAIPQQQQQLQQQQQQQQSFVPPQGHPGYAPTQIKGDENNSKK